MAFATVKGLVRMACVRAGAADVQIASVPSFLEIAEIGEELVRYWRDVSKGALDVTVHVHPPVVPIPLRACQEITEHI